jgi:hypothetical protein
VQEFLTVLSIRWVVPYLLTLCLLAVPENGVKSSSVCFNMYAVLDRARRCGNLDWSICICGYQVSSCKACKILYFLHSLKFPICIGKML